MRKSGLLTRLFFAGGVLLVAKGGFSVYPVLFPASLSHEIPANTGNSLRFKPGTYLFKLSLPAQRRVYSVVEGTDEDSLRIGPGHLEGSALPGVPGNSVIAGHRDTYFRVLKNVSVGDLIEVERGGKQYVYRVTETRVVRPDDTTPLRPESEPTLTLITCYPFYFVGPAPSRFIVRAKAVEMSAIQPEREKNHERRQSS